MLKKLYKFSCYLGVLGGMFPTSMGLLFVIFWGFVGFSSDESSFFQSISPAELQKFPAILSILQGWTFLIFNGLIISLVSYGLLEKPKKNAWFLLLFIDIFGVIGDLLPTLLYLPKNHSVLFYMPIIPFSLVTAFLLISYFTIWSKEHH
jgi:hypothetical protein